MARKVSGSCTEPGGCRNPTAVHHSHPGDKRHSWKLDKWFHRFLIPDLPWSFPLGPHLLPHRQLLSGLHCRLLSSWFWFSSALECPKAKRDHSQVFLLRNWVFLDQFGISLTSAGKRGQALSMPLNHLDIMNRGWEFWCVSDEEKALLSIGLFL